ncbi:DUF4362 domain-containing protein [Brevibacillus choshinensis]|uniref:DUF4362 domain-containing protein n=1 Tax=Brevibacillus choshinensis TaxID=54911 RepID=UPI002E1F1C16|nr:DUF4362 domain-containing protein [Brevibacillus choshinensis]
MKRMSMLVVAVCFLAACGTEEQPGTDEIQSAFPELTKPYRSEQAIKNGDVVNLHGKISNWERWEQFIKNVDQQKADQVRITSYTTEGDPIFDELVYDGKGIEYTYDDSMDAYGGNNRSRQVTKCEGIEEKQEKNGQIGYQLKGCDKEFGQYFGLAKKKE